jgi:hypothetical protein
MINRLVRWALKDELERMQAELRFQDSEARDFRRNLSEKQFGLSQEINNRLTIDFRTNTKLLGFPHERIDVKSVVGSILEYLESQGAEINVKPQSNPCIEITKKGKR